MDLEKLKDRKGLLSRRIGEAKKAGKDTADLLAEMRSVSGELKALKEQQKNAQKPALNPSNSDDTGHTNVMPIRFECHQGDENLQFTTRLVTDEDKLLWDAYVDSSPKASLYHRWEFKRFVELAFGHHTYYLAAFSVDGRVCGVFPLVELKSSLFGHFLVSMPFFNYGGIISSSQSIADKLRHASIELAKKLNVSHIEERSIRSETSWLQKSNKVSVIRDLPSSVEQLWKDIGTKVRAQIKKAQKNELIVEVGGIDKLDDFYGVFSENMRDLGTPVYGKSMFTQLFRLEVAQSFFIVVVYKADKPVSAGFLMGDRDVMEIPWASTLRSVNALNANMLLYWHCLSLAVEKQYGFFDFGRSSKDASTLRFKKQWGGRQYPLYWHYWLSSGGDLPELNPNNPKYRILIAVWQRLPLWLTRLLGPYVVKYLP